jgi:ATP-dependent Clp protease ATP-binding subunit ClpB
VQKGIFRVEFLNRFDDVIFFRALDDNQLEQVIALMLKRFALRLEREKNISIEFGRGVVNKIIHKGYTPMFGARSVARYIADNIEDMIAKKIITGEVTKGEKLIITEKDIT